MRESFFASNGRFQFRVGTYTISVGFTEWNYCDNYYEPNKTAYKRPDGIVCDNAELAVVDQDNKLVTYLFTDKTDETLQICKHQTPDDVLALILAVAAKERPELLANAMKSVAQ